MYTAYLRYILVIVLQFERNPKCKQLQQDVSLQYTQIILCQIQMLEKLC